MLGFNYYETEDPAELSSVELNQPLYEAGLQAGDVITAIDGRRLHRGRNWALILMLIPWTGVV